MFMLFKILRDSWHLVNCHNQHLNNCPIANWSNFANCGFVRALIISNLSWSDTAAAAAAAATTTEWVHVPPPPQVNRPAFAVRTYVPESLTRVSLQWLLQAPHLLPPAPPCLTTSITKPNTLCSPTWDCCLDHSVSSQLKVRNTFRWSARAAEQM